MPAGVKIIRHITARMRTKTRPGIAVAAAAAATNRTVASAVATNIHHSPGPASKDNNNNNETYPDQMVGDCPTKKPDATLNDNNDTAHDHQPGPRPNTWLQYGRQTAGL